MQFVFLHQSHLFGSIIAKPLTGAFDQMKSKCSRAQANVSRVAVYFWNIKDLSMPKTWSIKRLATDQEMRNFSRTIVATKFVGQFGKWTHARPLVEKLEHTPNKIVRL